MKNNRVTFDKEMKKDYTILIPEMAEIHFELLKNLFLLHGYNAVILKNEGRSVVDEGLKYVHNDTCYPALLVIGQMIDALNSGKYDTHKVALMITQTGGGCRASNYIHLLRKALKKAGYGYIPVISLGISGNMEKNKGFKFTLPMIRKALCMIVYGDLLMLLDNQVKPYETEIGASRKNVQKWIKRLTAVFKSGKGCSLSEMETYFKEITDSFAKIPVKKVNKTRVGIVGEIYVKYSPLGNNRLEEFLASQDCEVMVPGILGFMLYCLDGNVERSELYGGKLIADTVTKFLIKYILKIEKLYIDAVKAAGCFTPPMPFYTCKALGSEVIGTGCVMGEGWLLTAEMAELISHGYENIVCAQPFGCLPNHIVGKGMIRKLKRLYPNANIVPIDYDPGATRVNQENRIKLMLAVAREQNVKETAAKN